MLAIVAQSPGGPEVLQLEEIETPTAGPGEILIKIVAAGVNRADLLQRGGRYPLPPGASPILGLECSGTVAAIGVGVSGWQVGDSCVALLAGGGYAEYVNVPAGQVVRPPMGVDLVTAAGLVEVAATVTSNLDLVHLAAGETFLVHGGAGGIGTFAIQYGKAIGARVVATAGSADKLELCRSLGADLAVDYHQSWAAAIKDFTDGNGVDVILDCVGAKYLEANLTSLARGGRLAVIGMLGGRRAMLDLGLLSTRNASITATGLRPRPVAEKRLIMQNLSTAIWPMIASEAIRMPPETRYRLADASRAHARLESGENLGKIVLEVADASGNP